jgi:hypothetical protein
VIGALTNEFGRWSAAELPIRMHFRITRLGVQMQRLSSCQHTPQRHVAVGIMFLCAVDVHPKRNFEQP